MYAGKPIIGIVGGIGAGKSFVADLFGEMGCLVIHSDQQVSAAYQRPDVRAAIRDWWGSTVFNSDGTVSRAEIAKRVFADPAQRHRLEGLIFPVIGEMRDELMRQTANDPQVIAYVWDAPLLFEAGLSELCDCVVFVEAPEAVRRQRVAGRGWGPHELGQREKSQLPLDKKREMSDDVVVNAAGVDQVRIQVREVLSRVLAGVKPTGRNRPA